jgi:hypothetical protein
MARPQVFRYLGCPINRGHQRRKSQQDLKSAGFDFCSKDLVLICEVATESIRGRKRQKTEPDFY